MDTVGFDGTDAISDRNVDAFVGRLTECQRLKETEINNKRVRHIICKLHAFVASVDSIGHLVCRWNLKQKIPDCSQVLMK